MFYVSLCGPGKGTLRCYTSICDGIIFNGVKYALPLECAFLVGTTDSATIKCFEPDRRNSITIHPFLLAGGRSRKPVTVDGIVGA